MYIYIKPYVSYTHTCSLLPGVTLPVFEHYQEGGDSKYKTSAFHHTCTCSYSMLIEKYLPYFADKSVYITGTGVCISSVFCCLQSYFCFVLFL